MDAKNAEKYCKTYCEIYRIFALAGISGNDYCGNIDRVWHYTKNMVIDRVKVSLCDQFVYNLVRDSHVFVAHLWNVRTCPSSSIYFFNVLTLDYVTTNLHNIQWQKVTIGFCFLLSWNRRGFLQRRSTMVTHGGIVIVHSLAVFRIRGYFGFLFLLCFVIWSVAVAKYNDNFLVRKLGTCATETA